MKSGVKSLYSPAQISARVARMGKAISKHYAGKTLDVVAILENAFVFAADLVRHITCPVVCHFVRAEMRDVEVGGYGRREIFFTHEPQMKGRDVLLVDVVLHSGVTLDFLAKRIQESRPRSLRLAVLFDKPQDRKVGLQADYIGFQTASNYLVGYGLAGVEGLWRNLPYAGAPDGARQSSGRPRGRKRGKKGRGSR